MGRQESTIRESSPDARGTFPGESPAMPIAVSDLTYLTKEIVEGSVPPQWVRGEVTGLKVHRNGHWYFTLRDRAAQLRCVVWASDTRRIVAVPDEGMDVVVRGRLTMFAARADLQLRVVAIRGVGDGLWRKAFEATCERLRADGLLDPARKRPLPLLPRLVAVVTSPDGAVLHDVISVIARRCPIVQVVAVPATVQGDGAVDSLCAALRRVAVWREADLVIVGRGGGSREELWTFNDERVARALASCPMPTVAAIGHEVDVTICDLVADLRAATPSAAAEAAVPVLSDLVAQVRESCFALERSARLVVERGGARLRASSRHAALASRGIVERGRTRVETLGGRLHALSPLATMGRGYVLATDAHGRLQKHASGFAAGDAMHVRFVDGRIESRVERVVPDASAGGTS
ncbi:MAG: Exodeoxyribonuclease 7 large subunit [Gemmatimonadaceae bacterium]|nr:Exodeoxyribonuclease 7 large subunit [Gemmatimonadaceae bacterium]